MTQHLAMPLAIAANGSHTTLVQDSPGEIAQPLRSILRKNRNKITAIRIKPIGAPGKGARRTLESDAMEAG